MAGEIFSRPYGTTPICVRPPRTASWAKLSRPFGTECKFQFTHGSPFITSCFRSFKYP